MPSHNNNVDDQSSAREQYAAQSVGPAKVIAITSGKGGVGKTNLTTNLGIALSARGARVCIFDADASLANINVLLGLRPQYTLDHLLRGEKTLDEILLTGPRGIAIVPAASGVAEYAQLSEPRQHALIQALSTLERQYDYLLIDTAAGIGNDVLTLVQCAQYALVVISPEPTSLTDAFALVKVLKRREFNQPIYVVVNMAANFRNSMDVFQRFQRAVHDHLQLDIRYLGYIALDEAVISSVHLQRPVVLMEPDAPATRSFFNTADAIRNNFSAPPQDDWFSSHLSAAALEDTAAAESAEPAVEPVAEEPAAEPSARDAEDEQGSRESPSTPQQQDPLRELAARLHYAFERRDTDPQELENIAGQFWEAWWDRFGQYPVEATRHLYQWLEHNEYPAEPMAQLINTLELTYQKRHQRPLQDPESTIAKLFADTAGDPSQLRDLALWVCRAYERTSQQSLMEDWDWWFQRLEYADEATRERIAAEVGRASDSGQPAPAHTDSGTITEIRAIVERMGADEAKLRNGELRLSAWYNEMVRAREELARCLRNLERNDAATGD